VALEPVSDGFSLSIFEEVEHLVSLQIDEYGPVAMAAPKCPIIYPHHPYYLLLLFRCVP
jgi:hypothetical protein